MTVRIGLVSYRCVNNDISFNMHQIETAMKRSSGRADLLCFGEAFLQGFDSLQWNYAEDSQTAVKQNAEIMDQLREWTVQYGISLLFGYIEKDDETLYSSCIVLSEGKTVHNYRRISGGWKEYTKTDDHYREGNEVIPFSLHGKDMRIALCGDLWEYPGRFRTDGLLIWPVYVDYTVEEWNAGVLDEYAQQAYLAADDVLMINVIDHDPVNHGGAFHFHRGKIIESIPFDEEQILYLEI